MHPYICFDFLVSGHIKKIDISYPYFDAAILLKLNFGQKSASYTRVNTGDEGIVRR